MERRGGGGVCWLSDRISAPLSVSDAVNPVCPVVVFIIRLLMKDVSPMCLSLCALGAHQEQTNVFVALGPVRNNPSRLFLRFSLRRTSCSLAEMFLTLGF